MSESRGKETSMGAGLFSLLLTGWLLCKRKRRHFGACVFLLLFSPDRRNQRPRAMGR